MIRIAGRHKSLPSEIKRSLAQCVHKNTKIVITDICSCRHRFASGSLKITHIDGLGVKIRGYFGSGIVNLYLKFDNQGHLDDALEKISKN